MLCYPTILCHFPQQEGSQPLYCIVIWSLTKLSFRLWGLFNKGPIWSLWGPVLKIGNQRPGVHRGKHRVSFALYIPWVFCWDNWPQGHQHIWHCGRLRSRQHHCPEGVFHLSLWFPGFGFWRNPRSLRRFLLLNALGFPQTAHNLCHTRNQVK